MVNSTIVSGGVASALVILPRNIAFGMLAFSPLGKDGVALGATAGVMSAIISNLIAGTYKPAHLMPLSSFSLSALMLMEMNHQLIATLQQLGISGDLTAYALVMVSATCLIAGITKLVCGALKLGNLSRFVARPVLVGILNGTAILIVFLQLKRIFGIQNISQLPLKWNSSPETIVLLFAIAVATTICMQFRSLKYFGRVPSPLLGIAGGLAAFFTTETFLSKEKSITMIGSLPSSLPPTLPETLAASTQAFEPIFLILAIYFGVAIGLADVIRAALSVLVINSVNDKKFDINQELIAGGLGNSVSAFFGAALTNTGNATAAITAHKATSKPKYNRVIASAAILLIWYFMGDLFAFIPVAVIATVIIILTIDTLDMDYFDSAKATFSEKNQGTLNLGIDIFICLLMISLVIAANLIVALCIGVALSFLVFVVRSASSPIRRVDSLASYPSASWLSAFDQKVLDKHDDKVTIITLQGPIFFGSVDAINDRVYKALDQNAEAVILDISRATEIDSTAINCFKGISRFTQARGKKLIFCPLNSHHQEKTSGWDFLKYKPEGLDSFVNIESALHYSRGVVLAKYGHKKGGPDNTFSLADVDCLESIESELRMKLISYCSKVEYMKGSTLITQGSFDKKLIFLVYGSVSLSNDPNKAGNNFAYLSAGCTLGEISLFDDSSPASATVRAEVDTIGYVLSIAALNNMKQTDPNLYHGIILGVTKVFSQRLRTMNNIIFNGVK